MISEREDRRNYLPPWPRVLPAVVEIPIRGLLTRNKDIEASSTWARAPRTSHA